MLDLRRTIPLLLAVALAGGLLAEAPPDDPPPAPAESESAPAEGEAKEASSPRSEPLREAAAKPRPFSGMKRNLWIEVNPRRHEWVGDPISLSLRDADLVEVLRSFAKMTDANVIVDPSVKGKVTVELKNVPWDQALYVILKSNGLGMEITGNVWSMKPAERLYEDR